MTPHPTQVEGERSIRLVGVFRRAGGLVRRRWPSLLAMLLLLSMPRLLLLRYGEMWLPDGLTKMGQPGTLVLGLITGALTSGAVAALAIDDAAGRPTGLLAAFRRLAPRLPMLLLIVAVSTAPSFALALIPKDGIHPAQLASLMIIVALVSVTLLTPFTMVAAVTVDTDLTLPGVVRRAFVLGWRSLWRLWVLTMGWTVIMALLTPGTMAILDLTGEYDIHVQILALQITLTLSHALAGTGGAALDSADYLEATARQDGN